MEGSERSLLVLGLGNLLCADDGVGIHAVETIRARYQIPDNARVLDGGTLGLSLLSCFDGADDVVLIDAISAEGPAGTLVRLEGEDVAPAVRNRLSCHQIGVADLLDALVLLESYPERVILWGAVPESMELETALSPRVAASLPELIDSVVDEVDRLGYELRPRGTGDTDGSSLAFSRISAALPRGM